MNKDYIKVTLIKNYIPPEEDIYETHRDYYYHRALEEFIYYTNGCCITGWNRQAITHDKTILAYSCTTDYDYGMNDKDYLLEEINKLRKSYNIQVDDSLETLGEITVHFETE